MPLANALTVLAAFTAREPRLRNGELAARTGLPRSTVTRLVSTLVAQGYLLQSSVDRRFSLAPSVLALGYGAVAHGQLRCAVDDRLKEFADRHQVQVNISARDRLDLIVVDSSRASGWSPPVEVPNGTRVGIAGSPMGWTLLAALPRTERDYLTDSIERHTPREWQRVRRHAHEAIARVHSDGYYAWRGGQGEAFGVIATPVIDGREPPLVLACMMAGAQMTRGRIERELAPRLLVLAERIVHERRLP